MKRLILLGTVAIFGLSLSCSRGVNNVERGMMMSSNIYNDIAPQVADALHAPGIDTTRAERLRTIDQKLNAYKMSYDECVRAVGVWKSTGQAPVNTMDIYMEMWKSLIDAQTLAASIYIYASECTGRTAVKGTVDCL